MDSSNRISNARAANSDEFVKKLTVGGDDVVPGSVVAVWGKELYLLARSITPQKLESRLEKAERRGKKWCQSPTDGEIQIC
eukprot:scaffold22056_cov60-Cyclotella_meneghiniana.AAC.2